jgi:PAS domain-containing protein
MSGSQNDTSGPARVTSGARAARRRDPRQRITRARERFVAGEDVVGGVRPGILISWYRCREEHNVDPGLAWAPPAAEPGEHPLSHDVVFAELGGLAVAAARDVDIRGGLVTVTDGAGRVLCASGGRRALHRAADSNLAPWASWAESACGTNGMGTALEDSGLSVVRGPEHWCSGFHGWNCAGIPVRDSVTHEPLAVLNISCWNAPLPTGASTWLRKAARTLEGRLCRQACHGGQSLVSAFAAAAASSSGPLAALDAGGAVVIANDEAGELLGTPAHVPAVHPARRWAPQVPEVRRLARHAAEQARSDPEWRGSTRIAAYNETIVTLATRPVIAANHVLGTLIDATGPTAAEPQAEDQVGATQAWVPRGAAAQPPMTPPSRVIGLREGCLVLLVPLEVRFAESDRNAVWLMTDQGRLRAAVQGIDHLEQQLRSEGFLRVHRRFLVNLRRIKEIEQGFNGTLWLITDTRPREAVPVSRRHAPQFRRILGL